MSEHTAESDAPSNPRELAALASVGLAEPPADGAVVVIDGQDWHIRYAPTLTLLGIAGDLDFNGHPVNAIRLRQWNERVFLHEALHVILDQRLQDYHAGPDFDSWDQALKPPREAIVQAIEDALWSMGWRWCVTPPAEPVRHERGCAAGITNGAARCQCVTPPGEGRA